MPFPCLNLFSFPTHIQHGQLTHSANIENGLNCTECKCYFIFLFHWWIVPCAQYGVWVRLDTVKKKIKNKNNVKRKLLNEWLKISYKLRSISEIHRDFCRGFIMMMQASQRKISSRISRSMFRICYSEMVANEFQWTE